MIRRLSEARIGRTKEVKVLQGNWGYGWDDLAQYDKYDNGECRADLKAYHENDPSARYRVIFRRVPNEDYQESNNSVESIRRNRYRGLREGNASLKTNYAVIVYDMNTASYNLYTGTKKMCEQLYKDLFDFNIDDYDDDEKEDMYDWLYRRLNEFNCIERIDFRRGIDYRGNYSDGYDKYHIINYTKPRHPISLYL